MQSIKPLALLLVAALTLGACATDEYGNRRELTDAEKGGLIGAGIGVLAGLGAKNKSRAVIYGIVGGVTGAAVGNYMDSQKKDFEKQLQGEIQSGDILVEKLPQNVLMITMTAQTSFDVNSSTIKPGFYSTMDKIAKIVNKYGKTSLTLVGYTDNTGSAAYNKKLSERRAASVLAYLQNQGVIPQRLNAYGMGEERPRASNSTAAGRAMNRRVEIIIEPIVEQQN
ncbi:MAG: OmpA family protein [Gammaproteobacteria bacterium]|nr:OmpA family protein [Gammaproteobacteria bacterium]